MRKLVLALMVLSCAGCGTPETRLRQALSRGTGIVRLPAGTVELSSELVIPKGARDMQVAGAPNGTLLRASAGFRGRALIRVEPGARIQLKGFTLDGNRAALEKPAGLPPSEVPFSRFSVNNGILAEGVQGLSISEVRMANIAGFAILVSHSTGVRIENVQVQDSGSRNAKGRNNTSGGILLEEGTADFRVTGCTLRNVRGNGIWTHSLYTSPRNRQGRIADNRFETIGRDAIQVGHATGVRVERNSGARIGYPFQEVDIEGGGVPVAIDTAGNVDRSIYAGNRFEEVNGKCIDLDGFHHGEVLDNACINRGSADDYPNGHYGIVFNNSNPDMQSEEVTVARNVIDGAKFGGIFVLGSGNRILDNMLRNLNLAHCNDSGAKYGCLYYSTEPDLLRAGIYLGSRAARPAPALGNLLESNQISGFGMRERCIVAAPGVSLARNQVERNQCGGEGGR
jgi:hypothetical protein